MEPTQSLRDVAAGFRAYATRDFAGESPSYEFHTAVVAYFNTAARSRLPDVIDEVRAARCAPTIWVANEGQGVLNPVTPVPAGPRFVLMVDGVATVFSHPHGRFVETLTHPASWA